jgi:hypothetical protein
MFQSSVIRHPLLGNNRTIIAQACRAQLIDPRPLAVFLLDDIGVYDLQWQHIASTFFNEPQELDRLRCVDGV